jgi:hypothetical protein
MYCLRRECGTDIAVIDHQISDQQVLPLEVPFDWAVAFYICCYKV